MLASLTLVEWNVQICTLLISTIMLSTMLPSSSVKAKPKTAENQGTKGGAAGDTKGKEPRRYLPFLIPFRATLQLSTVAAILAVDFHLFPRRFAKTEEYGTSLVLFGFEFPRLKVSLLYEIIFT